MFFFFFSDAATFRRVWSLGQLLTNFYATTEEGELILGDWAARGEEARKGVRCWNQPRAWCPLGCGRFCRGFSLHPPTKKTKEQTEGTLKKKGLPDCVTLIVTKQPSFECRASCWKESVGIRLSQKMLNFQSCSTSYPPTWDPPAKQENCLSAVVLVWKLAGKGG